MLLKIFVKRRPHGELITNELQWSEEFHEANEIRKVHMDYKLKTEGFRFLMRNQEAETWDTYCSTDIQGYELYNDKGFIIDKYVTTIPEKYTVKN